MTFEDISKLTAQIKESEGFRLAAYLDTVGVLTIGYGHNCVASPVPGVKNVGDTITKEKADELLEKDISNAVWQVRQALPWVSNLDPARQAVLYDAAFNMGIGRNGGKSGLLSFRNTLRLIEQGNYEDAAKNMLKSKWAQQVGNRAIRLTQQLREGDWVV